MKRDYSGTVIAKEPRDIRADARDVALNLEISLRTAACPPGTLSAKKVELLGEFFQIMNAIQHNHEALTALALINSEGLIKLLNAPFKNSLKIGEMDLGVGKVRPDEAIAKFVNHHQREIYGALCHHARLHALDGRHGRVAVNKLQKEITQFRTRCFSLGALIG